MLMSLSHGLYPPNRKRWGGWRGEAARDKVTKRRRGKERVEWGRGPWRAVLAFLPRGPRVPSYATDCESKKRPINSD